MPDLTEHLLSLGPDLDDDNDREAWRIDGDREATWALRKVAAANAEIERIEEQHRSARQDLDEWRTSALNSPQSDVSFFTAKLLDYRRRLERDIPSLPQTYKVPGGRITRAKARVRRVVTDADALLVWAEAHSPGAVTKAVLPSKLDALDAPPEGEGVGHLFMADGEQVPGVELVRGPDVYGVTPADLPNEGAF